MNGADAFGATRWPLKPLGSLCQPKQTVNPRNAPGTLIRYIDISSVCKSTFRIAGHSDYLGADAPSRARKAVAAGDVIFATTRPYLRNVAQVPDEYDGAVCSTGFCVLRSNERTLPNWLYYLCLSDGLMRQVTPKMRGANYPAVSDKDVFATEVPVPPLDEQRRIVGRIREAMERVDELRQLREETKAEADIVEAAIFADFVEQLGEQEQGADAVTLGDILAETKYGSSAKANTQGMGVPMLRMGNIRDGHLVIDSLKHIELSPKELKKYTLQPDDLLINRTNSLERVGKAATFNLKDGPWVYASYLVRLRVDRSRAIPAYITSVINSRIGRFYVYRTARRAIGMVNINVKEIRAMPIPLPSIAQQEAVVARMADARVACIRLREQLHGPEPGHLTQAILRKAFAGEL